MVLTAFGLFGCSNLLTIQLPPSDEVMLHVVAASSLLFGAGLLPLFFYKGKEHQEHPCFQFVLRLDRFTYSVYLLYTYHALCTYCTHIMHCVLIVHMLCVLIVHMHCVLIHTHVLCVFILHRCVKITNTLSCFACSVEGKHTSKPTTNKFTKGSVVFLKCRKYNNLC